MDSAVHAQQMQVLVELENDLLDALVVAQARHDETLTRMDSSRRLIETLLQNEATETQLYIEDTTLEMRAIADVVRFEVENARREVERLLREAELNITKARAARAAKHDEIARKRQELETQQLLNKRDTEEEAARVKWYTEAEERRLWDEIKAMEGTHGIVAASGDDPRNGVVHSTAETASLYKSSLWEWPFIACLVVGALLWVLFVGWRARRAKAERQRRLLYSAQLRSHFANANGEDESGSDQRSTSPNATDPKDVATPDTARGASRRRPMLHRRVRPGWSPAASTASTASSPDDASELAAAETPLRA